MLRQREPVTLRSLVAGTSVSSMAIYTYFGSMDGMWSALRQEGFSLLGSRLAQVQETRDPVRDLGALCAAYVGHGMEHPDLYRVMFDTTFDLEDPQSADHTLEQLVEAVVRGKNAARFGPDIVPLKLATQAWIVGHGLVSLVATGPLPRQDLDYGRPLLTSLLVSAGDDPQRCRRSVDLGWSGH